MLVISRNPGEQIVINNDIVVTILETRKDGRVRVGVAAPRDVPIHRREVQDQIDAGIVKERQA